MPISEPKNHSRGSAIYPRMHHMVRVTCLNQASVRHTRVVCVCVRVLCVRVLCVCVCVSRTQIAHAMDELVPLPPSDTHAYDAMDETETETATMPKGGLGTLFSMIVAGLAGQTPHMIRCVCVCVCVCACVCREALVLTWSHSWGCHMAYSMTGCAAHARPGLRQTMSVCVCVCVCVCVSCTQCVCHGVSASPV